MPQPPRSSGPKKANRLIIVMISHSAHVCSMNAAEATNVRFWQWKPDISPEASRQPSPSRLAFHRFAAGPHKLDKFVNGAGATLPLCRPSPREPSLSPLEGLSDLAAAVRQWSPRPGHRASHKPPPRLATDHTWDDPRNRRAGLRVAHLLPLS